MGIECSKSPLGITFDMGHLVVRGHSDDVELVLCEGRWVSDVGLVTHYLLEGGQTAMLLFEYLILCCSLGYRRLGSGEEKEVEDVRTERHDMAVLLVI